MKPPRGSDTDILENYLFEHILQDQEETVEQLQQSTKQIEARHDESSSASETEINHLEKTGPVYYNAHIIKEGVNQPYITFNLNNNPSNPWQQPIDLHIPLFHKASKVKVILPKLPKPKIAFSRKHYRITVVRPTPPPPVIPPPPPEIEEKTLIYVLIKKRNETELEPPIVPHQNDTVIMHPPEVYFITYKTHLEDEYIGNSGIIPEV